MAGELESLLLMTIRDHPFIDARQLAHCLAIPAAHLYPALLGCFERGFLQALRVRSLAPWADRDLYALSDEGVRELARSEGVSPRGYQRLYPEVGRAAYRQALLSIHPLYAVRQLLALWAREWELAFWSTPARARFTYNGRPFWMSLHGWGWARHPSLSGGGWVPVCVEWDDGDVPVVGFRRRFGDFHRWSRSEEARASPEAFPILVVVTPSRHRALETLYCLRESSARWQAPWLSCYVTSQAEAFRSDGTWYRLGAEGAPGALLVGHRGLAQPLFPFSRQQEGASPTSEDGRRDKAVVGPPLSRLICSDRDGVGPHIEMVLRARLLLSHVEWRLLKAVARWPFLNSAEMVKVCRVLLGERDPAVEDTEGDLNRLWEIGLVKRYIGRGGGSYWYLAGPGIELLAAESRLPPRRYARFRGWWVTPGEKDIELLIGEYVQAWGHTRAVISFMLSLIDLVECKRRVNQDHELVEWDLTPRIYWEHGTGRQSLFPDTVASYRIGDQVYTFFLEVDLRRGHRPESLDKFLRYAQYYLCGAYRAAFGQFPCMVIVTEGEGRARAVCDEIEDACRSLGISPLPAYITTLQLLGEKGAMSPIWRTVGEKRLQHLFSALADEPQSTLTPPVPARA